MQHLRSAATAFIEPHPSPSNSQNTYRLASGRGGAGNIHSYGRSTITEGRTATGPAFASRALPPTTITSDSTSERRSSKYAPSPLHFSGRGGAGNARPVDERRAYDFEAELKRETTRAMSIAGSPADRQGSVVHVGRGGAGNAVVDAEGRRLGSVSTMGSARSRGSMSSNGSEDGGWRHRLSRVLTRD